MKNPLPTCQPHTRFRKKFLIGPKFGGKRPPLLGRGPGNITKACPSFTECVLYMNLNNSHRMTIKIAQFNVEPHCRSSCSRKVVNNKPTFQGQMDFHSTAGLYSRGLPLLPGDSLMQALKVQPKTPVSVHVHVLQSLLTTEPGRQPTGKQTQHYCQHVIQ